MRITSLTIGAAAALLFLGCSNASDKAGTENGAAGTKTRPAAPATATAPGNAIERLPPGAELPPGAMGVPVGNGVDIGKALAQVQKTGRLPPRLAAQARAMNPRGGPRAAGRNVDIEGIKRKVAHLYSMLAGQKVLITGTAINGPFVAVSFKLPAKEAPVQTVYVSGDGKLLTEQIVDLDARIHQYERDAAFADCLRSKGVKLYVNVKEKASLKQLATVGANAPWITIRCDTAPKNCARNGITTFPAWEYKGAIEVGDKPRGWIESFAGCK